MPEPTYEDVYEPPILDSTGQAIANAIQGLNPTVPSFISDAFSVERNYSNGDICIYDNKVYEFTSAKSAGAWDSTKVTQTTIGAVCTSLSNSLTKLVMFVNSETKSTSVASGANATIDHTVTVPNGYTALAVVGFQLNGTGAGSVSVYNSWLISTGARLQVHNHGTSSITLSSLCRMLCVRSDYA